MGTTSHFLPNNFPIILGFHLTLSRSNRIPLAQNSLYVESCLYISRDRIPSKRSSFIMCIFVHNNLSQYSLTMGFGNLRGVEGGGLSKYRFSLFIGTHQNRMGYYY